MQSVQVATVEEIYRQENLRRYLPFIAISPMGSPRTTKSFWANHLRNDYEITITLVYGWKSPNDARIEQPDITMPTMYECADEIRRLIGNNKQLGGAVVGWMLDWQTKEFTDHYGSQILQITTHFYDDLIPSAGYINDQNDLTPT
jgi:hypothetical protein